MCKLCGEGGGQRSDLSRRDRIMASTLIAVRFEHEDVMPMLRNNSDTD